MQRILDCTVSATAATWSHPAGPGGLIALGPFFLDCRVIAFCAPGLFVLLDWIVQPKTGEGTFMERLGCFSALLLS